MQSISYESNVTECNITKVVLFKSGLAYYEREASVPAGESCINLVFNEDEMHQVVSTLIVDDPEGGVKSVTFGKPKGFGQRRLIGEENKGFEQLLLELRGARVKVTFENKQTTEGLCLGTEKKWQHANDGKSVETSWISIFDTTSNSLKHVEMRWVTDIDILDRNVAQELQDALRNELTHRTEETHVKTQEVAIHLEGKEPRKVKISCVHTVGPWYLEYRLTTNPVRLDAWVVLQHPRHSFHNATLWAVSESLNVTIGPDPAALAEHCLKSAQPVTVIKNSPALIPLSHFHVEAKIICLYDDLASNKAVSLAVLLKNKSKLPTERGNVTIFQNGLYLGCSVINVCNPGDDQFLIFGNADFFKVQSSTWNQVTFPTRLTLEASNLKVQRKKKVVTSYTVDGLMLDKPLDLYVLHSVGWSNELINKDELIQIKNNVGIFKAVLEPTKKRLEHYTALKIEQRVIDYTSFSLNNLTRTTINKWLSNKLINQTVYDALESLISLNEKMDAHAKLMDQKIKEMDDTLEDGKRIIGNIGLVSEQLKEDSELRNKWMNQLLTYEEKYQEGRIQMREMLQQASEYERQVAELLQNLKLDVDLGDQIEYDPNANQFATTFTGFGFGAANQQQQGVFAKHKHYAQNLADNFGVALQSKTNSFGGNNTGFGSQSGSTQATFSFGSSSTGFGSSSQPSTTTSTFGSTGSTSTPAPSSGLGWTTTPIFSGFGTTSTPSTGSSPSPFGFGNTSTPSVTTSSLFGSSAPTTTPFGSAPSTTAATSTSGFGSTTSSSSTSTFGSTSSPATTSSGFGSAPAQRLPSLFGSPAVTSPSTATGGFTFGGSNQPAPPQPSSFSFGGTNTTTTNAPQSTPSAFSFGSGSSQPAPPQPSSFSFGGTTTTTTNAPQSTPSAFSFGSGTSTTQPTTPSFSFGASAPSNQPNNFQPTTVQENNQTLTFQHISAMPQYQNMSPEEIRVKQQQDQQQQQNQLSSSSGGLFGQPPQ